MKQTLIDCLTTRFNQLEVNALNQENVTTQNFAHAIMDCGARKFWTAKSVGRNLQLPSTQNSFKRTKTYDLSWAENQDANMPEDLLQVKLANKDQKDQEVLLFIGDLAFCALDYKLINNQNQNQNPITKFHGAAVIPINEYNASTHWQKMCPEQGTTMTLELNPMAARHDLVIQQHEWIYPNEGRIQPYAKSQYRKIFGAGTNAKFVGLFNREGKVSMKFNVCKIIAINFILLVYTVAESPQTEGMASLEVWWP